MSIGIIGAGISGLTLAYELERNGIDYHIWEAADQPGGYIQSRWKTGPYGQQYLCELGPNSLLGDASLLQWLDELGLTPELVFSRPVSKARYVFRKGQYRQLPAGPASLLFGSFFSWKTKLAIFRERNNTTLSPDGETLDAFFRRRFNNELVDYALTPFVAGVYAGEPSQLLVSETVPVLLQFEKNYGSVLRGLIKNQSASGRRQSFSFRNGMQTLPNTLAANVTNLSLNTPVERIDRTGDGWLVETASGNQTVDELVLAVGTDAAARLLASHYADFANALRQVVYPPMTVIHSTYKRADVKHPLNGFGGLNPSIEGCFATGHIWSSSVFDGRCPHNEVLITTMVGGQTNERNAYLADDVLAENVHTELASSFGIRADKPLFRAITRWPRAIPQYNAQIIDVRRRAKALENEGLRMCANWLQGVSVSDCIGKARQVANQLSHNSLINKF
ncbi:protoporphyrinogen oxidase [Spirosoma sp. SC4-14]|uniref:protoporphyrinogen oxidase n=1 Tax=Spirosoma sp. SC4-14 TaxID=3128900 RepID=UPI0030D3F2DA